MRCPFRVCLVKRTAALSCCRSSIGDVDANESLPVDPAIYDMAMEGRFYASDFTHVERLWLVGTLTRKGETVTRIAERMHTSVSSVQRLRREARVQERMAR